MCVVLSFSSILLYNCQNRDFLSMPDQNYKPFPLKYKEIRFCSPMWCQTITCLFSVWVRYTLNHLVLQCPTHLYLEPDQEVEHLPWDRFERARIFSLSLWPNTTSLSQVLRSAVEPTAESSCASLSSFSPEKSRLPWPLFFINTALIITEGSQTFV